MSSAEYPAHRKTDAFLGCFTQPGLSLSVGLREVWTTSGRWMEAVVMGLLVLELTDSPFQVALLFVFRWSPMLLMALLSGMFADRADRWRLLVVFTDTRSGPSSELLTALVATESELSPGTCFLAHCSWGWLYVLEFPVPTLLHI